MFYFNHQENNMQTLQLPALQAHQVLLKIHSIGINRADILQRKGRYPLKNDTNPILGLEVSASVQAKGSLVTHLQINDEVMTLTEGGAYASHVIVDASMCMPLKQLPHLNYLQASSMPEALMTLWLNLGQLLTAQKQVVLVRAATSGIGSLAIKILIAMGHQVVATCSSREKTQLLRSYMANEANIHLLDIIYADDLDTLVKHKNLTFNLVLDMLGGESLAQAINYCAEYAHIACIAFLQNRFSQLDIALLLQKQITLQGRLLRTQPSACKQKIVSELQQHVLPIIAQQKIAPIIQQTFNFTQSHACIAQIDAAHALMLSHQHIGKCLLLVK